MLPPVSKNTNPLPAKPKTDAEIEREINELSDRVYGTERPRYHRWNVSMEERQFKAFKRYSQDIDSDMAKIISAYVKQLLKKKNYLPPDA